MFENTANAAFVGLASGAIFAMVALGLSLAFRSTGILNVAQGDIAVLGAYIGSELISRARLPYGIALVLIGLGCGLLLYVFDFVVLRRLRTGDLIYGVVITIGLSFAIESLILMIWGGNALVYPHAFGDSVISFGGMRLFTNDLVVLAICLALAGSLGAALKFLPAGRNIRASASDPVAAELCGLPVSRLRTLSLVVSGILAGLAGMLLAPLTYLYPSSGLGLTLAGFVGAVIGGFGSMPGAVVGCLVVGLVSGVSSTYVSSSFSSVVSYGLLVVILMFRPSGLFGEEGVGVREV